MTRRRMGAQKEVTVKTDSWIATFGDLTSLMLTFFVLILSMSHIDKTSLNQISRLVHTGGTGIMPRSTLGKTADNHLSLEDRLLIARIQAVKILKNSPLRHKVHILIINKKMLFRLPAPNLFKPGEALLDPTAISVLKRLAGLLQAMPGNIRVEGHTYRENPALGKQFHSARELSLARAASVLHVMEMAGIDDKRLSLAGYGDAHPVALNVTPMDIARNRRVDIVLYQNDANDVPAGTIKPQGRQ